MLFCLNILSKYKASSRVVFHWYFLRSVFQPLSVWMTVTPSLSRRIFCWSEVSKDAKMDRENPAVDYIVEKAYNCSYI